MNPFWTYRKPLPSFQVGTGEQLYFSGLLRYNGKKNHPSCMEYPEAVTYANGNLISALEEMYVETGRGFIIIIDEWDCIFRDARNNTEAQVHYLNFLRDLLKNQPYVKLAYMTGILPIKKYGTHSALNMFDEYSMTSPKELARFGGFHGSGNVRLVPAL